MDEFFARLAAALFAGMAFLPGVALADEVHVVTCQDLNGAVSQLSDEIRTTSFVYESEDAAAVDGFIFIGWSISTDQQFMARDEFGRALDAVSFPLYEATTLTAHYVPVSLDADGDGLPDGWEIYWFGGVAPTGADDPDDDGYANCVEFAQETNPLLKTHKLRPGIVASQGVSVVYNPYDWQLLIIRSEPEGELFATAEQYVGPGDAVRTQTCDPRVTAFAYWTVNGVRQADESGRALDAVTIEMGNAPIEVVAVCVDNVNDRLVAYWYGEEVALDSDTDGDGYSLSAELANETNPTLKNRKARYGIVSSVGSVVQYNPNSLQAYVIRSEPEGELFMTISDYAKIGDLLATASYSPEDTTFAYWTIDGVRQADVSGRALDSATVVVQDEAIEIVAHCIADEHERMAAYWYGEEIALNSDTDDDGYAFSTELQMGMSPLFKNRRLKLGIVTTSGTLMEVNLQQFLQQRGAVFDGRFSEFPFQPTSSPFVLPLVVDLNDDGLFDVIVVSEGATNVFMNVGSGGSPAFTAANGVSLTDVDLAMNDVARLDGLLLDVAAPLDALSCTFGDADQDGIADLLVSDSQGRIWFYKAIESIPTSYVLQHKVWAGSHAGFAEGLRLAAVDWDEDGNLDCLAGTADGKLMLLRDPKVGRPTNLKALAGVDNVALTWDPNRQSRIRGYKVYRCPVDGELGVLSATSLPTYRDAPAVLQPYDYAVSSLSRFYTAGNSAPTVAESPMSTTVRVEFGKVEFSWNDAVASVGGQVTVTLSIGNTMNLSTNGLELAIGYDTAALRLLKTVPSALLESAKMPVGSGKLMDYVFEVIATEGCTTEVAVVSAAVRDINGNAVMPVLPSANAVVIISSATNPPYALGDVDGNGEVNKLDLRLLGKLTNVNGRKYTADQLKAGDFNGNGKLDDADYFALWTKLRESGIL